MRTAILLLLSALLAVPALAGPPANGTYKSTDIGGTMLPGRYSEFYWAGTKLAVNNTVNEKSWDGATLGTQWWWYCPWVVSPPTLLLNTVNGFGNGIKIWSVVYSGGFCYIDGAGPWSGGDPSYLATIDTWIAIVTESFQSFVEVGTVRTINSSATFLGYNEECMSLEVSNTEKLGSTGGGTLPAGYPDFWDWFSCSSVGFTGTGEWGSVSGITFTIVDCATVPTQQRTWGAVKQLYKD